MKSRWTWLGILLYSLSVGCTAEEPATLPVAKQPSTSESPAKGTQLVPPTDDPQSEEPDLFADFDREKLLQNLLLVSVDSESRQEAVPAFLLSRDDVHAYILAETPKKFVRNVKLDQRSQNLKFSVRSVVGDGSFAPAECLGVSLKTGMLLFRASAENLAGEGFDGHVTANPTAKRKFFGVVKVGERFNPVEANYEEGLLTEPIEGPLFAGIACTNERKSCEILITREGQGRPYPRRIEDFLEHFATPVLVRNTVAPVSGNEKEIEYELVIELADPMKRLGKPRLKVERHRTRESDPRVDVELVENLNEPFSHLIERSLAHWRPSAPRYRARVVFPNNGDADSDTFSLQVVAGGEVEAEPLEAVKAGVQRLSYRGFDSAKIPKIPGFDGIPEGGPRLAPLESGWQVTSSFTQSEESVASRNAARFLTPITRESSVVETQRPFGEGWNVVELNFTRGTRRQIPEWAVGDYSPDGSYLYLTDDQYVLRKIRTKDLVQVAHRPLDNKVKEVWHSKTQLVLTYQDEGILVLDPNTLKSVIDFNIPVRWLAVSPTHEIAAATTSHHLFLFDLAEKKTLHQIPLVWKAQERSGYLEVEGEKILDQISFLRFDPTGTRLFVCGKQIRRFLLEGQDLIYEGALQSYNTKRTLAFSQKDSRWSMPGASANSGDEVAIFDLHFKKLHQVQIGQEAVVGFDAVSDELWALNTAGWSVYSPDGAQLAAIAEKTPLANRMLISPKGGQAFVWLTEGLRIYRRTQSKD